MNAAHFRLWLYTAAFLGAMTLNGIATRAMAAGENPTLEVLEHHGNSARSGLYVLPALNFDAAQHLRRDSNFQAAIAGPVYAQPLYWHVPGGSHSLLLVATEQNLLYALDSQSGAVAWKSSLGAPVPRSALPCGNIDPLGISGTPVINAQSQALFVAAMVADQNAHAPKHLVFALSLKDGSVLPGWPLDVEAALKASGKSFASAAQNQRGALTIVGNTLYIPYGGHYGDCGDYHGWVVGIALDPTHTLHSWSTRARAGGVWATGGLSSDADGIYFATGNTMGAGQWSDGEAVFNLHQDLAASADPRSFFTPSNWQKLDATDADLGGTNPLLVTVPGATPSELVLALGKDGNGYLLNRQNLGGIGGNILVKKLSPAAIRTSPAYFQTADAAFIALQATGADCPAGSSGDLLVAKITAGSPPALTTAWCATANGRGSPIITTTDGHANPIVWIIGAEGSNRLRGFRGDTGAVVFAGGGAAEAMTQVRRFQTLIAVDRHLYVASDDHVYAFMF